MVLDGMIRWQITSVRPLMEQDWPSLYGDDEQFWAHEWEKHGTCAEDVFPTQLAYFNTTLALHVTNSVEVRGLWALQARRLLHTKHVACRDVQPDPGCYLRARSAAHELAPPRSTRTPQ